MATKHPLFAHDRWLEPWVQSAKTRYFESQLSKDFPSNGRIDMTTLSVRYVGKGAFGQKFYSLAGQLTRFFPRSDKMLIETGRARASIWHEPLTKLTQNAVWTTRQRELGIRVTNKATAWLATPGETHLFSAVLKTNRGIYSIFGVSGVKVSIWNLPWQARDGTPFFSILTVFFPCILRVICKNIISNVLFPPTCQADSRVGTHSCVWTWNFWQCRTSAWPHVDPLDLLFQVQVQEKIS